MRNSPQLSFDQAQRRAIEHERGPMLVVAGAGTGKTMVLTHRISGLISQGLAQPEEILAVTYTDNAAHELHERVERLAGRKADGLRAQTFHAYGFGLLGRQGKKFNVINREDLWVFLRRHIAELELRHFIKAANPAEFIDDLLVFFERCQDELVSAAQYQQYVERVRAGDLPLPRVAKSKLMAQLPREQALSRCEEIARVYQTVERMLSERGLGTFGHMIVRAVELLRENPELLEQERQRARWILIDEFQDCNSGQIELARLLAGSDENIFAVGDPDQAIYRFRGATSGAFDEFLRRFPTSQLVALEGNYRSLENILSCAFAVISRNPAIVRPQTSTALEFTRRRLRSAREEAGAAERDPVRVVLTPALETEAADIADEIEQLKKRRRARWSDFAVLYRSHRHRDRLTEELASREIPFVVAGLDVLDATAVRDLLAVLRAISAPDSASLVRVASLPGFFVKPEELRAAFVAAGRDADPEEVIAGVSGGATLIETIEQTRHEVRQRRLSMSQLLTHVLEKFQLDGTQAPVKAFCNFVSQWTEKPVTERGDLPEFLEYLEYFTAAGGAVTLPEPEGSKDAVRLLTAHAAKGLEFSHVFVVRLNTASFPSYYREPLFAFPNELRHSVVESREEKALHWEEERRLLYVAMTRARDFLALYAKPGTGRDSTPTGFLRELLKEQSVAAALSSRMATPLQIELPVPAAPETISSVAPWILMPPREEVKSLTLSATAIEMYERCPLQFKIAYDWRLPRQAVAAMHFGSAMHTALKRYFDGVRAGSPPTVADAVTMFEEALHASPVEDPLQRELYRKQGIAQVRAFVEGLSSAPPLNVLDTERSFRIEVGATTVTGRVDRLDALGRDGTVAITDYKTGSPRPQEDADKSLQLSLYALAAKRAWNLDPQTLVFFNLETNAAIETTRSEEELSEAEERVREVASQIAAGIFEAKPAAMKCRTCGYRSLCPATEQKLYSIERPALAASVRSS